jgi:hypothetical protein
MFRFLMYISAISLLAFAGCQDVVQIELDQGAKLYVIDAFISDQPGNQDIKITTSDAYFSNKPAPPVDGATVMVKDLTSGVDYSFMPLGEGNYRSKPGDTIGKTGHTYQLQVTIDGIMYTALTEGKRKAKIDTIRPELIDSTGQFGPPGPPFYICNLEAKDPSSGETDYYWIKTFRNDTLLFSSTSINVCIDGTGGPLGDIGTDSTAFTPPGTFMGFNQYLSGNTCKAEVHSITRDTYNFFIQAARQVNNGGLFATTPENVRSNIVSPADAKTKATGWFSVSGVASYSITLP